MAGWFGIERSNHDFALPRSWGKNIFTNAAPVSIAQYLSQAMALQPVLIEATTLPSGRLGTRQVLRDWGELIAADPLTCRFDFESPYAPYAAFTRDRVMPDKSDVVVSDAGSLPTRAFEIKLTAVPDSSTRSAMHDLQSAEIVARPPTIEQLAFAICESYERGGGRHALNELLLEHIANPQEFPWTDGLAVRGRISQVAGFLESVAMNGLQHQIPAVLNVVWRTVGSRPILEEAAFDVFVWTNFAFLTMFIDAAQLNPVAHPVTRPERSLVWLAKMLYDYSVQGFFSRVETTRTITYGSQTDKAGSFSGTRTLKYLNGEELRVPRVRVEDFERLMLSGSLPLLAPERRLDAVIYMTHLARTGDAPEIADLTSDADENEPDEGEPEIG